MILLLDGIGFPKGSISTGINTTTNNNKKIDTGNIKFFVHGLDESTNLSNIGIVDLPVDIAKHVKKMYLTLQASKTTQKNMSVIGYDGKLFITFSRRHIENGAERMFFRTLVNHNIGVVVSGNYQEVLK